MIEFSYLYFCTQYRCLLNKASLSVKYVALSKYLCSRCILILLVRYNLE